MCRKRKFRSEGDAVAAAAKAVIKSTSGMLRHYFCPICKAYHLTSEKKR